MARLDSLKIQRPSKIENSQTRSEQQDSLFKLVRDGFVISQTEVRDRNGQVPFYDTYNHQVTDFTFSARVPFNVLHRLHNLILLTSCPSSEVHLIKFILISQ